MAGTTIRIVTPIAGDVYMPNARLAVHGRIDVPAFDHGFLPGALRIEYRAGTRLIHRSFLSPDDTNHVHNGPQAPPHAFFDDNPVPIPTDVRGTVTITVTLVPADGTDPAPDAPSEQRSITVNEPPTPSGSDNDGELSGPTGPSRVTITMPGAGPVPDVTAGSPIAVEGKMTPGVPPGFVHLSAHEIGVGTIADTVNVIALEFDYGGSLKATTFLPAGFLNVRLQARVFSLSGELLGRTTRGLLVSIVGPRPTTTPKRAGGPMLAAAPTGGGRTAAPNAPKAAAPKRRTAVELVNLNTAKQEELENLPGIGPVKAEAILKERKKRRGGFASVDDLTEVPGIGPSTLKDLRKLVTV